MENRKILMFLIFLFLFFINSVLGESIPWSLKAGRIIFFWETQSFKAYEKVEIKGKDIWIIADEVEGDLKEGVIVARGDVKFRDLRGEFKAREIKYYFRKDVASLLEIAATYTSPEVKGNIYFSGELLEWEKEKMEIERGRFTTCDLEDPHYYLSASKITYISDDRIILDGVSLKFIFLPFSIPLFRYVISLKKEPVPFPQVGLDSQYIFLSYPFAYSLLGQLGILSFLIKYGFVSQDFPYVIDILQSYTFSNIKGSIKINLSGYLDNLDYPNLVFSWSHDQKIGNFLTLSNLFSYNLRPNDNFYSLQNTLRFTFTYLLNKTSLQVNYSESKSSKRLGSFLNLSQGIDKDNSFLFNLRYNESRVLERKTYEIYEEGRFTHRGKNYSLSIYENYRISDPKNLQLIRMPEISFNGTYSFLNLPLKVEGVLGYYIEPSSYMESAKLGLNFSLPFSLKISNLNLNANLGYKQDFYQTGDARYFIYGNISSNLRLFNIFSLSSTYNFQFLGRDIITQELGNTPFYFDYQGETNILTGNLFVGTPEFNISFSNSYNFLLNSLSPLNIRGKIDYKKIFILEGSTSYNWNTNKLSLILIRSSLNYSFLSLSMGLLLNPYIANPLQRIDYKLGIDIKGDWHIAGKLTLWGTYPSSQPYPILSLDKDLHCFIGKFTLNPNNGNIQFEISLKAIPTKKIGGEIGPTGFSLLPTF